ncbi:alpha/beta hydrolase [Hydrocarboniphaga sp.]|uniref:alpha/beta hydrolase n=1 Tax=Hydrocarboniphaga sp. TaxID=2033016 RepID=UPI003D0E520B
MDARPVPRRASRQAVFVHGMWSQPWVWQDWIACFERAGYVCHAVTLPGHEPGAPRGAADGLGIGEYVASVEPLLRGLPEPAVVIGHSMGGLITQLLAARLPVAAAVLICSATPAPVFPLRPVMLPGVIRHFLRPNLYARSFLPSRREAGHLFLNGLQPSQRDAMYERLIPESGRALYQLGFGSLNLARSNRVDRERITAPMLALSGARDHIIPIGVSRAMARWYGPQRLEFREYAGHAHWMLAEPGWERRVDEVLQWLAA